MASYPKLKPAAQIEPEESMWAYFDMLGPTARDVGGDLPRLVGTVFHRSMEAAWPSMLATGRRLASEGPQSADGWEFEAAKTGNPWQVAFTARKGGEAAGLLYVSTLEKERTEAAAAAREARFAQAYGMADPAERMKAISQALVGEIVEDEKATELTDEYRNPSEVKRAGKVSVHVFKDGGELEFHDGFTQPLADVLDAVGKGDWCHGVIGEMRPTGDYEGVEPCESSLDRCSQMSAAVEALKVLGKAIDAAGFTRDVYARGREVASWSYTHFGEEAAARLAEAAQVSVYADSGFAAQHSWETVWEFWKDSVEVDLSSRAGQIAEAVAMLRDGGYVSMENRYDCNDMDDFAHVVMDGPNFGTLWLQTQNGRYGVRFHEKDGAFGHVTLARVGEGFGRSPLGIDPAEKGFLGAFQANPHRPEGPRKFLASLMGRFHDRTVRDINNIMLTLESVHCCLKEDLSAARKP